MPQPKLISLATAVDRFTQNGVQYASGAALPIGSDAIVFGRELLRQGRNQLHAIFHCNSQQLNLLAGAGAVDKAECGFSGLEVFGFANGLRRSIETGVTQLEDYSNLAMAIRLLGGAMNWPFVPATVNIGSDIQYRSAFSPEEYPSTSKIPMITDPFSGRQLGAFQSLQPEVAAIHVSMADPLGNAIMLGTEWSRFELSRAAKKVILVADEIVHTDCMRQFPNLVRIPDIVVDAIVYWPFAAWPQSSPGLYDVDEDHMRSMNKALAMEETTQQYLKEYVFSYQSHRDYLDMIGNEKREKITQTETSFLMDPYRKWILSADEIAKLVLEGDR